MPFSPFVAEAAHYLVADAGDAVGTDVHPEVFVYVVGRAEVDGCVKTPSVVGVGIGRCLPADKKEPSLGLFTEQPLGLYGAGAGAEPSRRT